MENHSVNAPTVVSVKRTAAVKLSVGETHYHRPPVDTLLKCAKCAFSLKLLIKFRAP